MFFDDLKRHVARYCRNDIFKKPKKKKKISVYLGMCLVQRVQKYSEQFSKPSGVSAAY